MKKVIAIAYIVFSSIPSFAQFAQTVFEKSNGTQTATYFQAIEYYESLQQTFPSISIKKFGSTDAGYPLHLILFSADRSFLPAQWKKNKKAIILINNGIHAGEPDGIDATMMLLRDLATGKIKAPKNVAVSYTHLTLPTNREV